MSGSSKHRSRAAGMPARGNFAVHVSNVNAKPTFQA